MPTAAFLNLDWTIEQREVDDPPPPTWDMPVLLRATAIGLQSTAPLARKCYRRIPDIMSLAYEEVQ